MVVGAIVDGTYATFDGASTWTRATGLSSTGDGPVNVFSVVVSPADPNTVFVMGLDIDEELCVGIMHDVLSRARDVGSFVRIDMESSEYTELETPIFTCVALSPRKALDALDGTPSAVPAGA